jgi:hypothetical protein
MRYVVRIDEPSWLAGADQSSPTPRVTGLKKKGTK